ncbi:hypothetical protein CABS01_06024 [Colletotrichum abscissum]|uniref:Uncharacterized protein n=2 Tax=Colletotrichum acutatum species complex TaxID=2707335 RepID=A0A9P9X4W2_9PEZI|nr:uncharacterized protein CLUP02_10923 [Colletotrichum lupini]XP_060404786.1 uncharacterized protein CABS01_06024 [Colletotrichum abscissum]KAI3536887.1 hypothetical protein CABS02_12328 [Colletotrichum abscissum]KAK1518490.1 hypothetical protein CABS01_06024 [Colletotrichum abscissum]UQC85426.1 hypothetical protein CLUP02_10923 [Colletotrichum lupini]
MVVFVDLDDEDMEPLHVLEARRLASAAAVATDALDSSSRELEHMLEKPAIALAPLVTPAPVPEPTPTFQSAATEAFGCYPIVMSIAEHIDLNTLDSLARTSRQVRQGLLQYRSILLSSTLHCSNEAVPVDPESTFRFRARAGNWYYMEDGRNYNGKSGSCARDLVTECRRCKTVVCRNCAIKPPASNALRERHRRLCQCCTKAPIATFVNHALEPEIPLLDDAVRREICRCDVDGVWLCQPCGRSMRGADHDYQRIWKWRAHYGEVLGGLGTGIGEGDRGVICGRETACAGAKERENETDCDAEDAAVTGANLWTATDQVHLDTVRYERTPSPQLGPGYERHEIEGIGGVVKTKLVRMVRVGACVPEWDDEKSHHNILGREVKGIRRSWCGWCYRVIPGEADLNKAGVTMRQL